MKYSPRHKNLQKNAPQDQKKKDIERFASGEDDWADFLDEDLDILDELDSDLARDLRSGRMDDEW